MRFEQWLGELLGQNEGEVHRLLEDRTALYFLIVWSLFESKCFNGFVRIDRISAFSEQLVAEKFDTSRIEAALFHFHTRYQNKEHQRQLMHGQACERMDALVHTPLESFSEEDKAFFVALVAYRFRNNMFHGNKGVQSWLQYREQIALCTTSLEQFVSHAELLRPSLSERHAA
jgi:hypothetical protein